MRRVNYPIAGESSFLPLSAVLMSDPFRCALFWVYNLDYGVRVLRFAAGSL